MKTFLKPIALLFSLLLAGIVDPTGIVINKNVISLTTSNIGPVQQNDRPTIKITVKSLANITTPFNILLYGTATSFTNNLLWASQLRDYQPGEIKHFDIPLNLPPLDSFGIKLLFKAKNENGDIVRTWETNVSLNMPLDIDLNKTSSKSFTTGVISTRINENKIIKDTEGFDFSGMNDLLEARNYDELPLEYLMMDYYGSNAFTAKNVTFGFIDKANIFPNLCFYQNYVLLNLGFVQYGTTVYFGLDRNLYVHPISKDMSLKPRDGYILTKTIYLKPNCESQILNYDFLFNLSKVGISQSMFKKSFKYSYAKRLIGACHNSDYCIVGTRLNG